MTRHFDRHLVLLLALSAFAWLPLLTPGYFLHAHDAPHSLFFLQAFDEAIRDGAWWPSWGPNFALGYGYPLWIFYAPLAYYLGELFHRVGFSITTSIKLVDLLATVGATLSMYAWARQHFNKGAAAFAAIVYTYAPYHLLDLYVRSAVAEYLTFAFFPLVLWRWETLLHQPSRRHAILAALATAVLILTHHGAAFIFAMLLGAYLIFLFARFMWSNDADNEKLHSHPGTCCVLRAPFNYAPRITQHGSRFMFHVSRFTFYVLRFTLHASRSTLLTYTLIAAVLTLGLSAIFWLPMVLEQKYIVVEQWTSVSYNYQKHFVFLNQFFSPFWGFGYSGEGLADDMAFQLGLVPVVGAVIALLFARAHERARRDTLFFFGATLVTLVLMSPVSAPFWQAVPIAALVQFPWRLLALSTITLAWLAGAALHTIDEPTNQPTNRQSNPLAALLMLITALAGFNYTLPQYTERSTTAERARASIDFELVSYKDRVGYMTWASVQPQSSPLVAEYQAEHPLTKAVALTPGAQIEALQHGGESERVRVRAERETMIQFRIYYFPGWRARIDGQEARLWPAGPQALITLAVPAGEHQVELRFEDTIVRRTAKIISFVSLLLVAAWALWPRARRLIRTAPAVMIVILLTACASSDTPTPATVVASTPVPTSTQTPTPSATTEMPTATQTATLTPTGTPRPDSIEHVVAPNETLGAIALLYGTTVDAIVRANNLSDPRLLRTGQRLIIPLPTLTPTPPPTATRDPALPTLPPTPTPIVYTVQRGDTLSGIAARYNLPVDEIMAANGLKDFFIRTGQQLIIPPPTPTPSVTPTALPTVTPTPGLAFAEPMLLYPPDGATVSGDDVIVLNWTALGALSDDQYYVLRLRVVDGNGRSESIWLKTPSYRLPSAWRGSKIEWDVIVLQLTKTNADGSREGKIQSPFSQSRQFTWR